MVVCFLRWIAMSYLVLMLLTGLCTIKVGLQEGSFFFVALGATWIVLSSVIIDVLRILRDS